MVTEANLEILYLHFIQPLNKLKYRHMMVETNLNVYLQYVYPIYRGRGNE
jgi:hypothetical protein